MLAIAALAGLFAVFGVIRAAVICVVVLPIPLAAPGHKLRAAVWVCSLYPVLILFSFYATWVTAWCVLGHRPRVYLDDPTRISPIVGMVASTPYILLTSGLPIIWCVCAPVLLAMAYWNIAQRRTRPLKEAMQLVIPLCAWLLVFGILRWDPGYVLYWYFD